MVMTYDGALVMPSSYAVMNEEEMTYVEGGAEKTMTKNQCIDGLVAVGISSPQVAIAGALTYTMAKMVINKVATLCGLVAKVVTVILSWAAGQVIQLGYAVARGALNNGVKIWWNWNLIKEPIGINYNTL